MRVGGGSVRTKKIECVDSKNNIWKIRWDFVEDSTGISFEEYSFANKPTLELIKNIIYDYYNKQTDKAILSGFVWKDMPIWLSPENLFNYKAAFDLAIQNNGITLPVKFKFGTLENPIYYTFDNLVDFTDFYVSAMKHINTELDKGWNKKDNINWNLYRV